MEIGRKSTEDFTMQHLTVAIEMLNMPKTFGSLDANRNVEMAVAHLRVVLRNLEDNLYRNLEDGK